MLSMDKLLNNSILIIPNNLKEKFLLLKNNYHKLLNIKIMDLESFRQNYYFDYTTESICFIINKYNVNHNIALDILNNLYYIQDNVYENKKLEFLVRIKEDLVHNGLLQYNNLFKDYITDKKIYIYGYNYINNFYKNIFKNLDVEIIENSYNSYIPQIYEFENIDDEVYFVANRICELISQSIDINRIKIVKPSSEYNTVIKRIFNMYSLPIYFDDKYLYSTKLGSDFIKYLDNDINVTLDKLQDLYDMNNELIKTQFNSIVDICNKYNWCLNFMEIKDSLIEELKKCPIKQKKFKNYIKLVNLDDNVFDDNEFIFLLGFNQNSYPKTYKDDDYINDNLKHLFNLEKTTEKNDICYNNLVKNISRIKNIFISYKLKSPFNTYYPSQLIDDLKFNVIKDNSYTTSYSSLSDKLKLSSLLDDYLKYGNINANLNLLFNTYPNINYKTYNNQYNKIDNDLFKKYLKNNLLLSYSSINNFYRCGFRYYAENILKLQNYDNNFTLFIGNLFHYILSIMYNDNFDFNYEFEGYISNNYNVATYKEKFFLDKLKTELEFIIQIIKNQQTYTNFDKLLFEEVINLDFSKPDFKVTFKGIIDKLMFKKTDNGTLISIIDYKTGNPNLNLNNIIYGIDMQLCIYAYLSSKMKKFSNPRLVGIYLQKILNNEINIDRKKDYDALKIENLKLQGYSTNNENILKEFDKTYIDSKLIKSLKVGNNGFYAYSKIFDDIMLNAILEIVDTKINDASNQILNREFYINPKKIGIKNLIGCEHCTYKDLCFMNEDNIINLKEYKRLEFLKGDTIEMD